jgi:hypothetical protein
MYSKIKLSQIKGEGNKMQNNRMEAYNSILLFNEILVVSVFQIFLFWLILNSI